MKRTFSIKALFNSAWADYKKNWGVFILIAIIFGLVGMIGMLGGNIDPETGAITSHPIIRIVGWLLQIFISLGFIRFLLNLIDGKGHKIEDIFRGANSFYHFLYFAVGTLLYGILITIGSILFIVPGLIVMVGFYFVQYLLAEEKAGIFESFKESWAMTAGNRWKIFWLMILMVLFNVLGVIALVVGLLITIPMTYVISARLYRTLERGEDAQKVDTTESEPEEIDIVIEETITVEEVDTSNEKNA